MHRKIGWMAVSWPKLPGLVRYFDPNDPGGDGGQEGNVQSPEERLKFLEGEAKKAYKVRDELKEKLRKLEGNGLSQQEREEFDALRKEREAAEEERKRKAGEFDAWRQQITQKTQAELDAERQKAQAIEQKYKQTVVGLAFAGAQDLFGGPSAKTIYTPTVAQKVFGDYIAIDEHDQLVVKDQHGDVILDARTGKPASFSVALAELIESLPDKDYHLRGSGKVGSGSPGGSNSAPTSVDVTKALTAAQLADPKVRAKLKAHQAAAGGLQMGRAFDTLGR